MARPLTSRTLRLNGAATYAFLLYLALFWLGESNGAFGVLLFLYPFAIGVAGTFLIDPQRRLRFGSLAGLILVTYLFLSLALVALGYEPAICMVIGVPLMFPISISGITVARDYLSRDTSDSGTTLRSVLLFLPFLVAPFDLDVRFSSATYIRTDTIQIDAAPEVVWAEILTFPTVQPHERLWTPSHAILNTPVPVRSYMQGQTRHAIWSMGLEYEERITATVAPNAMDWDIHFDPGPVMDGGGDHIHPASDQFTLLRGRYRLEPVAGGTRLTLETDYRLATLWNGYISFWGQRLLSDNHRAILHVLKRRAEAAPS